MVVPQNGRCTREILRKWMIWGYPYCRKPPNGFIENHQNRCLVRPIPWWTLHESLGVEIALATSQDSEQKWTHTFYVFLGVVNMCEHPAILWGTSNASPWGSTRPPQLMLMWQRGGLLCCCRAQVSGFLGLESHGWGFPWPWGYPKKWMVFARENPTKMDDDWRYPYGLETPMQYMEITWEDVWHWVDPTLENSGKLLKTGGLSLGSSETPCIWLGQAALRSLCYRGTALGRCWKEISEVSHWTLQENGTQAGDFFEDLGNGFVYFFLCCLHPRLRELKFDGCLLQSPMIPAAPGCFFRGRERTSWLGCAGQFLRKGAMETWIRRALAGTNLGFWTRWDRIS